MTDALTLAELGRQGIALSHIDIVDMHAHIDMPFGVPGDTGPAGIVASMDRMGIAATFISTSAPVSAEDARREIAAVLAGAQAYPGRLLAYLRPWPDLPPVTEQEAEQTFAQGFDGLKLYTDRGVTYTHPSYEPYLAVANRRRLPVLFHTWGGERDLGALRELSACFPEASLIAGHAGSCNEADYIALARDCANVTLDLTLSASPRGLVARFVAAVGAEKIVWGSDCALFSQGQQLGKVLGADIAEEEKRLILGGNARRLLARREP